MRSIRGEQSLLGEHRILWTEKDSRKKGRGIDFKRFLFFTLLLLLLVGASLFYVWTRIQVIHLGYEISNALKENQRLTDVNRRMRLEVATLKSYKRIERIATEELKMVTPKPDQVIVIR